MSAEVENDEDRASVAWRAGRRHAWVSLLNTAVREIGDQRGEMALRHELEGVRAALRDLCKDFGDNDWGDDTYLGDVIEKHLARHLYDAREDDSDQPSHPCPTCGQTVYSEAVARLFAAAEKCVDVDDIEGARVHVAALRAELGDDAKVVGLEVMIRFAEPLGDEAAGASCDDEGYPGLTMGQSDRIDHIYQTTDAMLREGRFDDVDALLTALNPSALSIIGALSYLTITLPAYDKLAARAAYFKRCREHFERVDPERAAALLRGLERH